MASFAVNNIPDALVPDLVAAIAPAMLRSEVAAIRAIANKVVTGAVITDAEKAALGEAFAKAALKDTLIDYLAQQAASAIRTNRNHPAVTW